MHYTFGLLSFTFGMLSIAAIAAAKHGKSMRSDGSSALLRTLDHLGLVSTRTLRAFSEVGPVGLLTFDDKSGLSLLLSCGVALALLACALSLVAEVRREYNLHLAVGFICGAMALVLFNALVGLVALIFGSVAITALRRRRRVV
jgi:predicted membrane channel-forming protein YqfA (hemolysin III family)